MEIDMSALISAAGGAITVGGGQWALFRAKLNKQLDAHQKALTDAALKDANDQGTHKETVATMQGEYTALEARVGRVEKNHSEFRKDTQETQKEILETLEGIKEDSSDLKTRVMMAIEQQGRQTTKQLNKIMLILASNGSIPPPAFFPSEDDDSDPPAVNLLK